MLQVEGGSVMFSVGLQAWVVWALRTYHHTCMPCPADLNWQIKELAARIDELGASQQGDLGNQLHVSCTDLILETAAYSL